ncbi:hypothetical protein QJS10_CPB15g00087 [Acorus calamus]|uniref:Uncharacterized protein n=1 Tax=Acorus calamus TaxID=4465 RepID=A0AAV9D5F2_ACOCL|nr:hypothetical protein QJS10_CPB15g00087 [Acorus calamus]
MEAMGSMRRIKQCAHELLTIGEMGDDDESWELMESDLRLKSIFFFIDFNRLISGTHDEAYKKVLTGLTDELLYYMHELSNSVKSRSIPQTQECYADAAVVLQQLSSPFTCSLSPSRVSCITRRIATTTALTTFILAREATLNPNTASSFQLSFTAPDQTPEEAEAGIRIHAKDLLQVKHLIDSKSWKETQKALRESSSYLRQDLYTIIQAKPGSQRQQLRKLYSMLFNDVTRLDYAARDKDAVRVQEYYDNIVAAIDDIFARI